jgi:hypothetical protein
MEKEKNPTEVFDEYWVHARNNDLDYPDLTEKSGKWMIFPHVSELDNVWNLIKEDLKKGNLTKSAKCGTMKENPNATSHNYKLICVYTYDYEDEEDVMRVAKRLFELGIKGKLRYKADSDTLSDKYSKNGDKQISKYVVSKEDLIKPKITLFDFY